MTEADDEDTFTREQIEDVLAAFEDCDAVAVADVYADDGVFIDLPLPRTRVPRL